jgi:hypothetical protein
LTSGPCAAVVPLVLLARHCGENAVYLASLSANEMAELATTILEVIGPFRNRLSRPVLSALQARSLCSCGNKENPAPRDTLSGCIADSHIMYRVVQGSLYSYRSYTSFLTERRTELVS